MNQRKGLIKPLYTLAILSLLTLSMYAQDDDLLQEQYDYLQTIKGSYEGYQSSDCKNTISYGSLRNDIQDGLLTRASDGAMEIQWKTEDLAGEINDDGAWFVWITAMEITDNKVNFEVFVDDVKRFDIVSGLETSWSRSNPEGGILNYQGFESDQHGDTHGYMTMFAPKSWLKAGKPLQLKIVGEAAGENTWIIVFKASNIISYMEKAMATQIWLDISISEHQGASEVIIKAPSRLAGKTLQYQSGEEKGSVELIEMKGGSMAGFSIPGEMISKKFILSDDRGELLYLENLAKESVTRKLLPKAVLIIELTSDQNTLHIKSRRIYKPNTVKSILALHQSILNQGKIYLMNSSHQDIAWMDSPEKCVIERDTMLITPLIEQARINPDYRFDIEDALMIKEYVQRHPDKKETLKQLFEEGKISCGSSFTQPYEEMYSGEALIRQFYFGKKWLKDEFGYNANTYWNVDVPGRTLQMPQILKKSGTPFMMISRHGKGVFNWFSPDGSFVTAYSPGHYAEAFTPLQKGFFDAAEYLATSSLEWEQYYTEASPTTIVPLLSDWDMSPAKDYSHIIGQWESISELTDDQGNKTSIQLPRFKIVTVPEFFESFVSASKELPAISGERPALWLYIHGPSHQKALKASREGDILLTMAEKFATIDALTNQSFAAYPSHRLNKAWEAKIFPDHGWGGKNGLITDDLFRRKYEFAHGEASQILENATRSIASQIKTNSKKGVPVVVFNSLNWERTDLVNFQFGFDKGNARSIAITDASGNNIPLQYEVVEKYPDGSIQHANLIFIASQVPSIGYKTFYITSSEEVRKPETLPSMENSFYKIELGRGGLKSIYDKALKKELIDASKFEAGEVFTMQSAGNGAGEFDKIQQPSMEEFGQTSDHPAQWVPVKTGDVFSAWTRRSELPHAVVEQKIVLHHQIKRIDFEIALLNWDGTIFREFRMAMPLQMEEGQVAYEVPFGVVEVGKDEMEGVAGERYQVPAKDLHPRGIENWIGASDDSFGVTLSSSVAVADYTDPTDHPLSTVILQPLLMASRRSCHWEGNEYLQTGDHYFSFSMSSHQPGWINGYKSGRQANESLVVVVDPKSYANARLPQEQSFFSIEGDDVVISTIKKAEDEQSVIVRMYDLKGENRTVHLRPGFNFNQAISTNLIEEEIKEIPLENHKVNIVIGHHAIETIKLK